MVPTKFVSAAVTMLPYALPQLLNFVDQFLTCQLIKVFVHNPPPGSFRRDRRKGAERPDCIILPHWDLRTGAEKDASAIGGISGN
jgi:hypothetical protein